MPRYLGKFKKGVLKAQGLSRRTVRNKARRRNRVLLVEAQQNEGQACEADMVQASFMEHNPSLNHESELDEVDVGEMTSVLQTPAPAVMGNVWANPRSSPFIVLSSRRRCEIEGCSIECEDFNTPKSSRRVSSTPVTHPVKKKSHLMQRKPRSLFKESDLEIPTMDSSVIATTVLSSEAKSAEESDLEIPTLDSSVIATTVLSSEAKSAENPSSIDSATLSAPLTTPCSSPHSAQTVPTTGSNVSGEPTSTHSGGPTNFSEMYWRYLRMRDHLSRKEFRRITGVNQENFEVLYDFLGGDAVCTNLKYEYGASTPKKKRLGRKRTQKARSHSSGEETTGTCSLPPGTSLTSRDELFLTLVRLRRGFSLEDMALFFGLSKTRVSVIFYTWVQFMYFQFKRIQVPMCLTRHDQPPWKIAPCFRRYKNFRMVLDTTEVRIEAPYHYRQQGNTYSSYKSTNVILYMFGISGSGTISFISPGFEGAMSDKQIFKESGLIEYLEPGDLLLVDRGFIIKDVTEEIGVTVVHPPFAKKGQRFSPEDNMLTKRIGSDRSHVERGIRKVKSFNILKKVTNSMLPILDQIVYVCGCLVNFDAGLVLVD